MLWYSASFFICIQQALYGTDVEGLVMLWQAKDWPSMAEPRITRFKTL